ncbi:MAG: MFS transporter [Kofleriaceae bacterium]
MSSWKRVAFLLFVIGWGANHFGALLLVYRARLHLDPSAPQLLFGLYALGLVPGLMLSGSLSDRYGRRRIVIPAAIAALCASILLGAGGDHFELLLIGRLLYGMACGAVMNPGAVWILELSTDAPGGGGARRATIALSAGFGAGPLISGVLAQWAPAPVILPYVVHSIALVAAIAIAAGTPGGEPTGARGPLLSIGVDRDNRAGFLTGVLPMAPFVFAFPVIAFASLPAMLGPGALGSAPIAYIGLLGAITLAAGVLAQPVTRKFPPTTAARVGLIVGALGCGLGALVVATHITALLLVVAAVLGVGYGVCMTSGLRNVELLAKPATRGGLTGLYYVLTYVGFAVPYILAIVTSSIAPATALEILAGLAVMAAIALRKI